MSKYGFDNWDELPKKDRKFLDSIQVKDMENKWSWKGIYEGIDEVATKMSDRFGLDHFTLYNGMVKDFEAIVEKMRQGYVEEKPYNNYPIVTAVKADKDGNTVVTFHKGKKPPKKGKP